MQMQQACVPGDRGASTGAGATSMDSISTRTHARCPSLCCSVSCKALTATNAASPVTTSTDTLDTQQAG